MIGETGYWKKEQSHMYHVHSENLGKWLSNFFFKNTSQLDTIIDYGCGTGNYVLDLRNNGFKNTFGIELEPPINSVIPDIICHDLTNDKVAISSLINNNGVKSNQYSAISLEVGEHIPSIYCEKYLNLLTQVTNNYLVLSWAVRGQAGIGHVNCLDNHEVIEMFEGRNFLFLKKESDEARNVIEDKCEWFRNTILIFKKNDFNLF